MISDHENESKSIKTIERVCLDGKSVSVCQGDILDLDFRLDVMMVSAFQRRYVPTQNSMIGALYRGGISVEKLARKPEIDLRKSGNIWLSKTIENSELPIGRIGCVELSDIFSVDKAPYIANIPQIIRSFFKLTELAASMGMTIKTLGLSLPGTGNQDLKEDLVMIPLLDECLWLLKNCEHVKNIYIIEYDQQKAENAASFLRGSYTFTQKAIETNVKKSDRKKEKLAFISYSHLDKNIADNLCSKLENNGFKVWIDRSSINDPTFGEAIVKAINRASQFIVILSKNSLSSRHVLNEISLAIDTVNDGLKLYPMKIDEKEMGDSFRYYLSSFNYLDASCPPLEKRLDELVARIKADISSGD